MKTTDLCKTIAISVTTLAVFSGSAFAQSDSDNAAEDTAGAKLYSQACIACHGADGKGVLPGVSDFASLDGPLTKSDAELIKSITEGRTTPGAVLSMPAKGGNPTLTNDDIVALIAYLRSEFGE